MQSLSRRQFLHDSAKLAAAVGAAGAFGTSPSHAAAKKGDVNDQIRIAVIGVGGRGSGHVSEFSNQRLNTSVAILCDADEARVGPSMKLVEQREGKAPKYEQDLRRIIDDKSIDAVTIATPNHWHALAAIWFMQAGKDVYVEKPVSHNVSEGRRIVQAAERYNRICQTGTQIRSAPGVRAAMDFMHSGQLGKITLARGLCYKARPSIGKVNKPQTPPKTVDYDLWCGPAPLKPLMRKKLHYDWHWQWDFGNGDLGNQGIHQMDLARWGLGKNEFAKSVYSIGGRFGYKDDGQTANTQICVFDYGDSELIFEVRGLPTEKLFGVNVGNIFYGEKGYLVISSYTGAVAYLNDGGFKRFVTDEKLKDLHNGNFVKAVRSRKREDLHADILEGHLSSSLCHLANISHRLGTEQPFSKSTKAFGDDKNVYEALARTQQHLIECKVPLEETNYILGRKLAIDSKTESFVNDSEANQMLTRDYRKPFAVPEKV